MAMTAHLAPKVVVNSLGGGAAPPAAATSIQSSETLPDAIDYLDHHGGGEVTFASRLSGHIIELTHLLPTIDAPIDIHGLGENRLGVDGHLIAEKSGWMVTIASGISGGVKISGIELTNRHAPGTGGGINAASPLTLKDVEVRGNVNEGGGDGAGIYATSPLTIDHSRVSYNDTHGDGGAIFAKGTEVKISGSSFINNRGEDGAAIADLGGAALSVDRSMFTADFAAAAGGAVYAVGSSAASPMSIDVTDSTVVHNSGHTSGGAIDARDAVVSVTASTLFRNHAPHGHGIALAGTGSLSVRDTILADVFRAGRTELESGSNTTVTAAYSLVTDGDGTSITAAGQNIVGTSQKPARPLLGRLGYHGGAAMTMAPRPASLAIDNGRAFGVTVDQLGAPRTVRLGRPLPPGGDGTDIGAVEHQTRKPAFRTIRHTYGDQRLKLRIPAGYGCPAPGERFVVRFTSRRIHRPGAKRLTFKHAGLWIGRGVRHVRTSSGSASRVVYHRPNARSRHRHAVWRLRAPHTRRLGLRKLRLVLRYRLHFTLDGRRRERTVTRTVHSRLNIC